MEFSRLATKAAYLVVEGWVYFPKGLVLPLVEYTDLFYNYIQLPDIACAFCGEKVCFSLKKKYFHHQTENYFRIIEQFVFKISFYFFQQVFILITHFFPEAINEIEDYFQYHPGLPFLYLLAWLLLEYRQQVVWYGLLPLIFLLSCVAWSGIAILPEMYIFFIASSWAGKILNYSANLIVRRKHSQEYKFLQEIYWVIRLKKDWELFKNDYQTPVVQLGTRLILELSLIMMMGRFSQFLTYCFHAFFSWLTLYLLIKVTADETPTILIQLEKHLAKTQACQKKGVTILKNTVWLFSYQAFKRSCSQQSFHVYSKMHAKHHHKRLKGEESDNTIDSFAFRKIKLSC